MTIDSEYLNGESGCDFTGVDQPYVSIVMKLGFIRGRRVAVNIFT